MSLHEWLRNLFTNWEKLTSNKKHSEHGKRIRTKIFIRASSKQDSKSHEYVKGRKMLVEQKIQEFLRKGAIACTNHCKNQFFSNLFLREKKMGSIGQ